MSTLRQVVFSLALAAFLSRSSAASVDQWRTRSIYQIIVDRYALSENPSADQITCNLGHQTWCGGTWNSIRENLDYIKNAGFTAIWISPISQNYEGPRTAYGDAYHGYWISDVSKLNARFGSSHDLKALSNELHRRGMYLMVDIVVNNVMSSSPSIDYSQYFFKEAAQYHQYCSIAWGNKTSEEVCWLGDNKVVLPDVRTEDSMVVQAYSQWIQDLVKEYNIDGLRIDAAKHVEVSFWLQFCESAGVFCIGEVFDSDPTSAAQYQGPRALHSILNFPMYSALVDAFAIPGKQDISAVTDMIEKSQSLYTDPTVLGNFIENHDLPRWASFSVDPQSLYNAMVFTFMTDGIPIVYYGQEHGFNGTGDPWNREPLWSSEYSLSQTYQLITKLNRIRNYLVETSDFPTSRMQVLNATVIGIAIQKGAVVTIVTNIGSPPDNRTVPVYTSWSRNTIVTELLSCHQYTVGSSGALQMQYYMGGAAGIFISNDNLQGSGLCGFSAITTNALPKQSSEARRGVGTFFAIIFSLVIGFMVIQPFL